GGLFSFRKLRYSHLRVTSPLFRRCRYLRALVAAPLVALPLLPPAPTRGQQPGMASPTRPARKVKPVETPLPPIKADVRDIAGEAGLLAENVSGGEEKKRYILETTGGGVALLDYDDDGALDVFLVNGTTLDGDGKGAGSTSHLYRNKGGLRFEDVTAR